MKNEFQKMYVREPDKIYDGDYYYNMKWPWVETECESKSKTAWSEKEKREVLLRFKNRSFMEKYREGISWRFQKFFQDEDAETEVADIFRECAKNKIPVVDIGSGSMGMTPYILNLNPDAPCLITSNDKRHVSNMRSVANDMLANYNISFAVFDEIDIPMHDCSADVVTGVSAVSGTSQNRIFDNRVMSINEWSEWCASKMLREVYRILKPGGYYILSESNGKWRFDWEDLESFFISHDKIYDIYPKDEFIESLRNSQDTEKYMLNDEKIKATGFEIVIKKTNSHLLDNELIPGFFARENTSERTRAVLSEENIVQLECYDYLYVLRKMQNNN